MRKRKRKLSTHFVICFFGAIVQRIQSGPPHLHCIKPRSIIATIDMKAVFLKIQPISKFENCAFSPLFCCFLVQNAKRASLLVRVQGTEQMDPVRPVLKL